MSKTEFIDKAVKWLEENVKVTDAEGNVMFAVNTTAFREAMEKE